MTREEKIMKSSEVRADWKDVLQYVRTGGTVRVEHYNQTVALITPPEPSSYVQGMTHADLLAMHLSYSPGQHVATDEEVWRRWPHLREAFGRMEYLQQAANRAYHEADPVDLDEFPPPTPGYAEAMATYETEVQRLMRAPN
jgi:antitoxin (DNA-binding transcriptional repressor) of toxin-antitoxin stability system